MCIFSRRVKRKVEFCARLEDGRTRVLCFVVRFEDGDVTARAAREGPINVTHGVSAGGNCRSLEISNECMCGLHTTCADIFESENFPTLWVIDSNEHMRAFKRRK